MSRLEDIRNAARQSQETNANVLDGPSPKGTVKEPYVAFGAPTGDAQIRLIIYAKKYFMMPRYDVLYDVFFDGAGEFIGLVFPHHRIKMFGRNLLPIVMALRTNTVEWVREWDNLYLPVSDPEAPVITSIETGSEENPFGSELKGASPA